MIRLIQIALERPYTFVVMALAILLSGVLAVLRTPTDIFPDIKIPVIAAVWTYTGLPPEDMSGRIVYFYERQLSSTVNDIEHIESQSLAGYGIVKIFFQPNVDIRTATAQVTSISQTVLKQMPPGVTPPLILNYNASTVPILQLTLAGAGLSEQQLFDFGQNFIRPQLATIPGIAIPSPYGGKVRQVQIDLDPKAMAAVRVSAQDVQNALAEQTQIIPAGTQKIGTTEYRVKLNNSPEAIDELRQIPIRASGDHIVLLRDIASVRDGNPPQSNIVRVDGSRATLMTVLKTGAASTLEIVRGVREILPLLKESLPAALKIEPVGDQSIFVKAVIDGVIREAIVAACLTALMILLFLGNWRSTLIIAVSIPLSILLSLGALHALGETINVMTLGGLALAVGILVDDATVTIENIERHLRMGSPLRKAILDGASEIAVPAVVSTLCICIVFVPMFFLGGVTGYLFMPMAEAVIFAMLASSLLSRTLVPTMAATLLRGHASHDPQTDGPVTRNPFVRFQKGFERVFERIRVGYFGVLTAAMSVRKRFIAGFLLATGLSFALVPFLGRDFFPSVDTGQIKLHVRAPLGTRIEQTTRVFDAVEQTIREVIPPHEITNLVDNIGLSVSGINTAYANSGTIGAQDGDILITLAEGHQPTDDYVVRLRRELAREHPGVSFSFLPADIVSQILNFGIPAPIDIQIAGPDLRANEAFAQTLLRDLIRIPGMADARIQQAGHLPQLFVEVDRERAKRLGLTERDVTNSLVVNMAGSGQVSPTFWLNKKTGVSYPIVAQTPEHRMQTLSDLENLPIVGSQGQSAQILGGVASVHRTSALAVVSHYAVQPVIDIYASQQLRDLGSMATDIDAVLKAHASERPKGATITVRGQVQTMQAAFTGLLFGLASAIVLIYLLIVVNFQSWKDPFIVVAALPTALAGIVWMLTTTHTTLSVPALTGAIMCMGVATANSILVVSMAREQLAQHGNPVRAAMESGFMRFRPVLMTALAMIIGMAPMALGLGEGGEQNAPLGRAAIGGLGFATVATLFFVPVLFSLLHKPQPAATGDGDLREFA
jgi:CzcA family heavy metal efflux pump